MEEKSCLLVECVVAGSKITVVGKSKITYGK